MYSYTVSSVPVCIVCTVPVCIVCTVSAVPVYTVCTVSAVPLQGRSLPVRLTPVRCYAEVSVEVGGER
jgi:hypothetical protein